MAGTVKGRKDATALLRDRWEGARREIAAQLEVMVFARVALSRPRGGPGSGTFLVAYSLAETGALIVALQGGLDALDACIEGLGEKKPRRA